MVLTVAVVTRYSVKPRLGQDAGDLRPWRGGGWRRGADGGGGNRVSREREWQGEDRGVTAPALIADGPAAVGPRKDGDRGKTREGPKYEDRGKKSQENTTARRETLERGQDKGEECDQKTLGKSSFPTEQARAKGAAVFSSDCKQRTLNLVD